MSKYSYIANDQELAYSFTPNHLYNMEGYMVAWESDPKVLQNLLPAPLEVDGGTVSCYVSNILNPTLMPWYRETSLMIQCKYGDRKGSFTQSLLLEGPGTEMGAYLGREKLNMPKKFADSFVIDRMGEWGRASVGRGGVNMIEIEADINGKYNNAGGEKFFAEHKVGNRVPYNSFFFLYGAGAVDGKPAYINGTMVELEVEIDVKKWEPATVDIKLGETPNDPWAELEVKKVLGGSYCLFDMYLNGRIIHEGAVKDTTELVKRTLKHRFDVSTYGHMSQKR